MTPWITKPVPFNIGQGAAAAAAAGSPELETGSTGGLDTLSANLLFIIKYPRTGQLPTPVIGNTYNSIALNITTALPGGNYKLGAYDDNSGEPDALYEQTGDFTPNDGYTYRTVTDFDLASTVVWLGNNHDTGILNIIQGTTGDTWDRRYYIGYSYGSSMPDPAPAMLTASSRAQMKLALL